MKYILVCLLLFPLTVMAQAEGIVRGDCTPPPAADVAMARGRQWRLPVANTTWDSQKVYKQLVILLSFSDTDFQMENPQEIYDMIFNAKGYNQRNGKGCVADYFSEQSGGLFNLQFDVFGPYKVSQKAQPYSNPSSETRHYGREEMREATKMMIAENPDHDFSQYDWDDDGQVNQVAYVYAGYSGNQASTKCYGHIWPNTSTFSSITTPDGKVIQDYTISGELWYNDTSCGIGTICHEFTHSLGLPDIYPTTSGMPFSVVDEWDLMDGGNFTNYGWCPPNYTSQEKMLLGWLKPTELTEPATITGMKPVSQGGEVYQIKHTNNEYLLLENRQWDGWDAGLPGKGLVVYHVNYIASKWSSNTVNNTAGKPNFTLVHADGLDFDVWNEIITQRYYSGQINSQYQNGSRMNSYYLSTSAYPWTTDSTDVVNDSLTDNSVPAALMYKTNSNGSTQLSKPITNISMGADGLVSFDFMGGVKTLGDVDGDGAVTMADIVEMVGIIALGGTEAKRKTADVNGDGQVTVADIICAEKLMVRTSLPLGVKETTDSH